MIAAHPGQCALRRADLRRVVREGADIVAEERIGVSELAAGELDAITAIPGKKDDDVLARLDGLVPGWGFHA